MTTMNTKADKKLSLYLSTKRLAVLTRHANGQGLTHSQCLYELIDALEDPLPSIGDTLQADMRRIESLVQLSVESTCNLTEVFTQAMEGQPRERAQPVQSTLAAWLAAVLGGRPVSDVAAVVIPNQATSTGVRFTVHSLMVGQERSGTHPKELTLSREQAGPALCVAANQAKPQSVALVGKRVEGTHWHFRFLVKDAQGKWSQQVHTFSHPSRDIQEAS